MKPFNGRRILFIGIGFYDYEDSIVARLREQGAVVTAFSDRPKVIREGLVAALLRRTRANVKKILEWHERRILAACANTALDQVLIIKGTELSPAFLIALRAQQPRAEFILYQWDSLARLPGIQERLSHFDRILTFDRKDAVSFPYMTFRPLFFREADATSPSLSPGKPSIDISFVGWLHSDRLDVVRKIERHANILGLTTYMYLYTGFFSWLILTIAGKSRDVHFRPLSYKKLMEINAKSVAILDLPHADQSGLTMRTIEALGLGKKLITTGNDIIHYDFYSDEYIHVVTSDKLQLDLAFFSRPTTPVSEKVRLNYCLNSWLADVFQVKLSETA